MELHTNTFSSFPPLLNIKKGTGTRWNAAAIQKSCFPFLPLAASIGQVFPFVKKSEAVDHSAVS
jgi:hypothetical protein